LYVEVTNDFLPEATMKLKNYTFLILCMVGVFLSACRTVVETRVESDGSGALRSSVVYSVEETQNFAQNSDNTGKSICDDLKDDVPPDATFAEEVRDGETFCTTSRTFSRLSELRELYGRMGNVTVNTLSLGLSQFVFDVDVNLTTDDSEEGEPIETEWRLTVPGTLETHNGDQTEGKTVIWTLTPGQPNNLHAESSVPLDLGLVSLVGGVCLVLVAGILVAAFLFRRRNSAK
jgi:hypothetical protein